MDQTTTCCIAGGGPAGALLGLLLARSGIDVIVLEKHGDFLRDFRGDTIHPSTLDVLDELGLGERFERLPHRKVKGLTLIADDGEALLSDLRALRSRHPYIALVPQWDFLDMITEAAAGYPGFRLLMKATAYDLVRDGDRIAGLRYRDAAGGEHEIRALLTVAADGRDSTLRRVAGLRPTEFGAPVDVAWFALPRADSDREDSFGRFSAGRVIVALNRTDYWQLGYLVPQGGFDELRRQGVEALRGGVAELLPFLSDRVEKLEFDAVSVLKVQVNRLRRWHLPGLLFIGDAAHAMSPIGGVGINLAVQDAVAAANLLYAPLRRGELRPEHLAAVRRRRRLPTVLVQSFQRTVQAGLLGPALRAGRTPSAVTLARLRSLPWVARGTAQMIGYGPRPEHVRIPAAGFTAR
jgi:2-polyprenyl-6-methoxyphenol hydroxylase-like FAD-dependent oxidoreductase